MKARFQFQKTKGMIKYIDAFYCIFIMKDDDFCLCLLPEKLHRNLCIKKNYTLQSKSDDAD